MLISPRILRAEADSLACRPRHLSVKEQARETKIRQTAAILLARHGTQSITFAMLALAMRLSTRTLRFHFVDLDGLLGAILQHHLAQLAGSLAAIPATPAATYQARRQAAWREAAQDNPAHILLERDRHLLPDDLRATIEPAWQALAKPPAPATVKLPPPPTGAAAKQPVMPAGAAVTLSAPLAAAAVKPLATPATPPPEKIPATQISALRENPANAAPAAPRPMSDRALRRLARHFKRAA